MHRINGLIYAIGERVLTQHGWGEVTDLKDEEYEATDEIVTRCTVRLDKVTAEGLEEVRELNPRKDYHFAVISFFWMQGQTESSISKEEFLEGEEEAALKKFEIGTFSHEILISIFVDYRSGKSKTRFTSYESRDGEFDRFPLPLAGHPLP